MEDKHGSAVLPKKSKKSNKGLIIGLSIGGGTLIIVSIILIIIFTIKDQHKSSHTV